ncbi:hypothetical protein BP5796_04808 [Coleophoma crateriformis]|uniref:DUF7729 domain-containing protein n=1 Tax=Coleophoma crateriformis TaxID=565419 RepID=A0A3D8SAC8_9HELO|nr:hypothetical protein BP5796_04808 [Coleophoma crateriformis]
MMLSTFNRMDHDREEPSSRHSRQSVLGSMNASRTPRQRSLSHHARCPAGSCQSSKPHRHNTYGTAKLCLLLSLCFFVLNCSAYSISLSEAASTLEESLVEGSSDVDSYGLDSPAEHEKVLPKGDLLRSALQRLAESGTIVVDQRPPPVPVSPTSWELVDIEEEIKKRMEKRAVSSSASSTASSTAAVATATASTTTTLPTPFDSGFSNNITDSCSTFMNSFLNDATFKTCLPFSLLLQSSNSFFQVEKSLVRTTQLLDYTCSANVTACTTYTTSLAANVSNSENCGSDLRNQNPLVIQALVGLQSYQVMYQASCLKNSDTGAYCFADAVTNSSSPTDSYPYYLPLNVSLPGGSQPTCDSCLKSTMDIFQAATTNRSSTIASTYSAAAQLINVQCGPTFLNTSLASVSVTTSAAAPNIALGNTGLLALVIVIASWFL